MHRMPRGQSRSGGTGFQQVPQSDAELYNNEDIEHDDREQQRLSRQDRFRNTFRHVLRQSSVVAPHNATFLYPESSPALSDTTLVGEDYVALPIQQFDDVDLRDGRDAYDELERLNLPEVVGGGTTVSHSHSTKAGKGLEVRVESYPLALSPGGLYIDDRSRDYGYQGCEGLLEKTLPDSSSRHDYKPAPLRWRFVLIVLGGLVAFLALLELALHLLPDASHMDGTPSAFQNATEIHKRSTLDDHAVEHHLALRKHPADQDAGSPTTVGNPAEVELPTGVDVTGKGKDQATTSAESSATKTSATRDSTTRDPTTRDSATEDTATLGTITTDTATKEPTSTTQADDNHTSSTKDPVTEVTNPGSSPSRTTALTNTNNHADGPTQTRHWHPSPTQQDTTAQQDTSTRQGTTTRQDTFTRQDTSTQQDTATQQDTTTWQDTATRQDTTTWQDTTTQQDTNTRHDTTIQQQTTAQQQTTTQRQTTIPTPNGPDWGGSSAPDHPTSFQSTQAQTTTPVPIGNPGPPAPTASITTTKHDYPGPPETTHLLDTTTSTVDQVLTSPRQGTNPDPTSLPSDGGGQPTSKDSDLPSTEWQPGSGSTGTVSRPDATKPTSSEPTSSTHDTDLPETMHTGNWPSTYTSPTLINTTDQTRKSASDTGSLAITTKLPTTATVTSKQLPPTSDAAKQTLKIHTTTTGISQAGSSSTDTQLPPDSDQRLTHNTEPFTIITMAQGTETPPPPITTVFTTSSSVAEGSFVEVTMKTTLFGHIKAAESVTELAITTTYPDGTVSTTTEKVLDELAISTQYDAKGIPTETTYEHSIFRSQLTVLSDPRGYPTATLKYYDVYTTTTLFDSNNIATATVTTIVAETPELVILKDANGRPTWTTMLLKPIVTDTTVAVVPPTPTTLPSPSVQRTYKLHRLPDGIYFAGLMLPTLLAILVSIPVRILSRTVKLYQGFHALASDRGAGAADSMCLKTTGPASFLDGLLSFQNGKYLLGLTSVLVILSALTIPFSAEVFRLIIRGSECDTHESSTLTCSVVLGVFPVPAQVLAALLIILIIGIIGVALVLRRWKTGLERNPWNFAEMSQLAAGTDMRRILQKLRYRSNPGNKVDNEEFFNKLRTKTFGLRDWEENGVMKYSVLILTQEVDDTAEKPVKAVTFVDRVDARRQRRPRWLSRDFIPFFMLSWTGRILFLLLLGGVLIAVLTYDTVARGSEYQRGLTGKAIGIRFLFSGAGVLVTFAWGSFFNAVAFLSPYKLLNRRRLMKGQGIHVNPAMNPFTGFWVAFIPSRRDIYLGVVAAAAILSEFLPLYLGNIPCNGVQVESAETVCVFLSVAILSIMMLIVVSSFFVDWPSTMGIDPSTIAGAMYAAYVFSVEMPLKPFFKKEASNIV